MLALLLLSFAVAGALAGWSVMELVHVAARLRAFHARH